MGTPGCPYLRGVYIFMTPAPCPAWLAVLRLRHSQHSLETTFLSWRAWAPLQNKNKLSQVVMFSGHPQIYRWTLTIFQNQKASNLLFSSSIIFAKAYIKAVREREMQNKYSQQLLFTAFLVFRTVSLQKGPKIARRIVIFFWLSVIVM